jgi:hypothetical protein
LRNVPRQKAHAVAPQPVAYMMQPHGMKAWVEEKNLEVRARGGVGLEDGGNVLAHGAEETCHGQFSVWKPVLSSQFSEKPSRELITLG